MRKISSWSVLTVEPRHTDDNTFIMILSKEN